MTILSINEKFTFRFVCPLRNLEEDAQKLSRKNIAYTYEDVTKENSIAYASGRPEVLFTIPLCDIETAFHIKWLLK